MRKISIAVIILLALTMLVLAACSPKPKTPPAGDKPATLPKTEAPVQGSISHPEPPISSSNGETSTTLHPGVNAPGVPSGTTTSAQWPKEVPLMPGLQGVSTSTAGMNIMKATGTVKPAEVEKFYSTLQGWTKKPNQTPSKDPKVIAFAMEKDGGTLTISITAVDGKTNVEMMYMPKK